MSRPVWGGLSAWPWRDPMFRMGAVMLALVPLWWVATGLDERTLFGRSPWEKPLRFSLSLGVYAITIALAVQWLLRRTRVLAWRWLSPVLIGTALFEIAWIGVQALRGVDSHFNDRTAFEALMFSLMGVGAAILSVGVLWVGLSAVPLACSPGAAKTRLLSIGVALGFIGTGLLLPWTGEALVEVNRSQSSFETALALPVLGWRFDGTDPRPAHFMAAHLMQLLPIVAIALTRWRQPSSPAIATGLLFALSLTAVGVTAALMP